MQLTTDLGQHVQARLHERLSHDLSQPVAIAVSGGGDSMALLHLSAAWARTSGRRLVVLSVDHGLNPMAGDWNALVKETADRLKVEWRELIWTEEAPATGLQAAARQARHALLADAARATGAGVLLMGHTADDVAEAHWMRAHGAPLGQLREWAPSPAWPQGRGLMLFRPMLEVRRAELRGWLSEQALNWIEDPANCDLRFLRSRARAQAPETAPVQAEPKPPGVDYAVDDASGVIRIRRNSPWLAQALICASGRPGAVSASMVEHLRARVSAETASACLAGAVVQLDGRDLVVAREPGRAPPPITPLSNTDQTVWDGRFLVTASEPGWRIAAAAGRRNQLGAVDRQALNALPRHARGVHPVLFRDGDTSPVLASPDVEALCLVGERLRFATRQVQTEDDLSGAMASLMSPSYLDPLGAFARCLN